MQIENLISSDNTKRVKNYLEMCNRDDGSFNYTGFWKLKRKLCPQASEPPIGKRDDTGELVVEPEHLKNLYLDTYRKRLSHREMKSDLSDLFEYKTNLWCSR